MYATDVIAPVPSIPGAHHVLIVTSCFLVKTTTLDGIVCPAVFRTLERQVVFVLKTSGQKGQLVWEGVTL